MHPDVFTQINIHAVFAVRGRGAFLLPQFRERLFQYIAGILRESECFPLAVGGHKDHAHLFFELDPRLALSDVIGHVKSVSGRWINAQRFVPGRFEWQRSYGAFSYARSQRDSVIQYIGGQERHHQTQTFREEYLGMLKAFDIPFEDRYLFEFYED